ncbi:MAG: FAD-binding protein [Calditrichaeota bacterium]|nr:FAD-binding protein [Calditrichota bacterium]
MPAFWTKDRFRALRRAISRHKVLTEPHDLALYAMDATRYRAAPEAVVLAETAEDIQATVRFAAHNEMHITPRGAGSGLSGGSVSLDGGIVLSCERMKRIEVFDEKHRTAIVQPGVVTSDLQTEAAKHNLFYPPDPSSHTVSTIGGNAAENAGGLRCFKYGVTSHYITGLEYVDYEGEIRGAGCLAASPFEPDLTGLLIGSEGTLGVFTRIALQLLQQPAKTAALAAYFDDKSKAFDAVEAALESGLVPSILEYIDQRALSATAAFTRISYPPETQALALIECDGSEAEVEYAMEYLKKLLFGLTVSLEEAKETSLRERLWQLRRGVSPSLIRLSGGKIHEDVAVPRDKLRQLADIIENIVMKTGLEIPVYGHIGDGNLHIVVLYDLASPSAVLTAEDAAKEIFRIVIDLGGTITGEHGIGLAKREFLPWQHSKELLKYERLIKKHFDPQNIFNSGKMFSKQRFL